jgi:hypothetical protein
VEYFSLLYRLNAENRYLIWCSNEKDSVAVDAGGFIPTFKDSLVLRQYAEMSDYVLKDEEPILHDLDWVVVWTKSARGPVNCEKALAAWNLFSDVAVSIRSRGTAFKRLDAQCQKIYMKLFWGNNLLSMTPEGSKFVPVWSPDEIAVLVEILATGLALFASSTRRWPLHDTED